MTFATAILAVLLTPALALAHGSGHGGGGHGEAKPAAGTAVVAVDGYHVELLSDPSPIVAGAKGRIIAKISAGADAAPVSGGRVQIALARHGATPVLAPAIEVTWAGSYTAEVSPERSGLHHATVVVDALGGRRFDPPLTFDFQLDVAAGAAWPLWTSLAIATLTALGAVYAVAVRARTASPGPVNLLEIGWLRRGLTSPVVQASVQSGMLVAIGVIAALGLFDVQNGGTNLATKLTWTIWWAGIIFTFVLAGRIWCVACPFGALNEWASRLTSATRRLPRAFRNVWWATAAFVVLTLADEQFGVVRSPRVTAWLVIGFAALAIVVGLAYARRSFCRHLCPIGGLIGIYSMTAPVELRVADTTACRRHETKECFHGSATSRGCPMFEFPQTMDRNNYCTFCGDCARGCSRGNVVLRLRSFGKDLWQTSRRALDEAYLAVALVGLTLLVTADMLTAWPAWVSAVARSLPTVVRSSVKPVTYLGAVESLMLLGGSLVVGPLLVLGAAALADRLAGTRALGVRRAFITFAYMFVPVGLAMHLAHNLSHLLLEGGGIVPAVQRAVLRYTPFALGDPDWTLHPLVSEPIVGLLQMGVLIAFFALSLHAGHRLSVRVYADRRAASRAFVPFAALAFVFTVIGIALLNQPMGMRHGM